MASCSVGICAYNEEANIARIIDSFLQQRLETVEIKEVFVVCSGCTDETVPRAQEVAKTDDRVKILVQAEREGKVSAINLFMREAAAEILVLSSGDLFIDPDTVELMVREFEDPTVGMAASHPVPVNDPTTMVGFAVYLIWQMHHNLNMVSEDPKCGEMIAYRNVVGQMPIDTINDELYLDYAIKSKGYRMKYVPDGIVRNKGPEHLVEFVKRRRCIYAGHLRMKERTDYESPSMTKKILPKLPALFRDLPWSLRTPFFVVCAAFLEALSRVLGYCDIYIFKKEHYIWYIAPSTKDLGEIQGPVPSKSETAMQ